MSTFLWIKAIEQIIWILKLSQEYREIKNVVKQKKNKEETSSVQ